MAKVKGPVDLWNIVQMWIHEHYKTITVKAFGRALMGDGEFVKHIGRIAYRRSSRLTEDIGFIGPRGILIWLPSFDKKKKYVKISATDPSIFKKINKVLRLYESKSGKRKI